MISFQAKKQFFFYRDRDTLIDLTSRVVTERTFHQGLGFGCRNVYLL